MPNYRAGKLSFVAQRSVNAHRLPLVNGHAPTSWFGEETLGRPFANTLRESLGPREHFYHFYQIFVLSPLIKFNIYYYVIILSDNRERILAQAP
jgi:hypothetical protein